MYCTYCGIQIDDSSRFCEHCGKPQHGINANPVRSATDPIEVDPQRKSGMGAGAKVGIAMAAIAVVGIAIGVIVAFAIPKADDKSDDAATARQEATESISSESKNVASESAANAPVAKSVVALKDASKGDLVVYGKYKQSGGLNEEDIEWVVLEVIDGHALLLSAKALDCQPISSSLSTNFDITWEKSDIRDWLNGSFLDAFTDAEVNGIDTADVEQSNSADGKTQDKVFLLSKFEFVTYVTNSWAIAQTTEYAQDQGASVFGDQGAANWWLRDYNPSQQTTTDDNNFLNVFYDGTVNDLGYLATEDSIAIRPAMWVSLDGSGVDMSSAQQSETDNTQSIQEEASQPNDGGSKEQDSVVSLSVETLDGSSLEGTVRRDEDGFVLPDSSSREYSMSELRTLNLSDAELCVAWNEPFARQGYHFKNPGLRAYFQTCDWYIDTGNNTSLSGVAAVNNDRLRQIADERPSGTRWKELATN